MNPIKIAATLMGLALFGASPVVGASVALTAPGMAANLFGGKMAVVPLVVTATEPFRGTLGWRLASEGRTLARREQAVVVAAGSPVSVEIRFEAPAVKEGTALATTLEVEVVEQGAPAVAAQLEKTIWIFPENAWAERGAWLKQLNLRLFDPDGKTAALLEQGKIPFTALRNVDALADLTDGVLIVGEGISFKDYRGLARSLWQAAAGGAAILCLAPREGEFPIADASETRQPQPVRMDFRQHEIILELDKRLDAACWPTEGAGSIGIQLQGARGPVVGEISQSGASWRWIEMTFAGGKNRGRLVVTGLALFDKWKTSPAPRYLLLKMLEHVAPVPQAP
ncbi:MAG: hypothetical protein NTV49_12955 [Kiritimatiellaeota bacterium]|nr:hypothetical protein [Kiritimatiellota bacterium]